MSYVRKNVRRGATVWVIDIPYRLSDGANKRFRRDVQVQTRAGAEGEARRLLTVLAETGDIPVAAQASPASTEDFTFADAVKFWEANNTRKGTTVHGYRVNFEAHLVPRFGKRIASTIAYEDVTKMRAALASKAITTANNIEIALRALLRFAARNGKLPSMPTLPPLRRAPRKEVHPPRSQDVAAAIAAAYPAAKLAMALASYAGLRSGEIRGLRFMDVDLPRDVIIVRQAICRGIIGTPKSGNERKIPIAAALRPNLDTAFERRHKPTDLVSVSSLGTVWGDASLLHAFHSVLRRLALPVARMHDLRHLFVTQCFQAGASAPTVQKLAGHGHLSVTQLYAHSDEDADRKAIDAFSERIEPGNGSGNRPATEPKRARRGTRSKRRKPYKTRPSSKAAE